MKKPLNKKILTLFIVFIIILTTALTSFANTELINIVDEVMATKEFYRQNKTVLDDWQETIACGAVKLLDGSITPAIPIIDDENKETSAIYAKIILVALAQNKNPKNDDIDPVAKLISLQGEDGSFGDIYSSMYSIIALDAAKASYNSEKAINYLLSLKFPDGGYAYTGATEGDLDTTGMILTVLSKYKDNSDVKTAIDSAKEFIHSKQQENGGFDVDNSNTLAVCIQGLIDVGETLTGDYWKNMPASLVRFKNPDGSYKYGINDPEVYNAYATTQALMALNTIGSESSPFKTLIDKGAFSQNYKLEDFMPLIILFLVLAAFSLVFWAFIMFRKKPSVKNKK
ncbi:MAG: hypothetical protein K0S55_103 [Clostridia bacterium]|jgi:hypothetical protein|nr:hypothetical protein [Clostridia bacterium]